MLNIIIYLSRNTPNGGKITANMNLKRSLNVKAMILFLLLFYLLFIFVIYFNYINNIKYI